ncbi:MAG: hypothetical protein ACP5II_06810 [Infirmifilum sp.]|jgi:predicted nucleic acid-binding protein
MEGKGSTSLLLDSTALAVLHSRKYKQLLPLLVADYNLHVSIISIIELLTYLSHERKVEITGILPKLRKIYTVIDQFEDKVSEMIAQIQSDLLHYNLTPYFEDIVNVAIASEKKFIILTADPERYNQLRKYGVSIMTLEQLFEKTKLYARVREKTA